MILKLKTWYSIHKWMSIFTGIAILMWLITGIVITIPGLFRGFFAVPAAQTPAPPDFRGITMSPADAVARLEEILGQAPEVSSVRLRQVWDVLAYQVALKNGDSYLIEAQSGQEFTITPELAEQMAREAFPTQAGVLQIERLDGHNLGYAHGPTPAYRIVFDDDQSTFVHVSIETGEVQQNDRLGRVMGLLRAIHTFGGFESPFPTRNRLIVGLLWLSSVITIFAALIGYYLALPRRWQRRWRG